MRKGGIANGMKQTWVEEEEGRELSPRREKHVYQKQRGVYLERVPKKGEGGILGCWPEPL